MPTSKSSSTAPGSRAPLDVPDPPEGGEKLVDAKAVATLYRSRVSGGAIALLVLAMLVAVIVALYVARADATVLHLATDYWNRFLLWAQGLVS